MATANNLFGWQICKSGKASFVLSLIMSFPWSLPALCLGGGTARISVAAGGRGVTSTLFSAGVAFVGRDRFRTTKKGGKHAKKARAISTLIK
jgi:hypothetical protein